MNPSSSQSRIPREQYISYLRNIFSPIEQIEADQDTSPPNVPATFTEENQMESIRPDQSVNENNSENEEEDEDDNSYNNNSNFDLLFLNSPSVNVSTDSSSVLHNYIDFRTYPININWKEVENYRTNYFEIFQSYGYFGIGIFTSWAEEKFEWRNNNYIYSIIYYFYTLFKEKNYSWLYEWFNKLPQWRQIEVVIEKRLYSRKEVIAIQIILDWIGKYRRWISKKNYKLWKEYNKVVKAFYSEWDDEDITYMNNEIWKNMKQSMDILIKWGVKRYKDKKGYWTRIMKNERKWDLLLKGVDEGKFVL